MHLVDGLLLVDSELPLNIVVGRFLFGHQLDLQLLGDQRVIQFGRPILAG